MTITRLNAGLPHTKITASVDLNTLTTTGVYSLRTSCTNAPMTNHGTLIVEADVGTPYQIYIPDNQSYAYKRWYTNSAWTAWVYLMNGIYAPASHTHTKSQITDFGSYLPLSGGTMTGQLITSFKSSVAMGSFGSSQTTVPNLCNELRYSSGCVGSANITTAYTNGTTVPTGWYNFIWSPHRSGGNSGAVVDDNCDYGTLYLSGMTMDAGPFYIRFASGSIQYVRGPADHSHANHTGSLWGASGDISTRNDTDTWVPVLNSDKWQHAVLGSFARKSALDTGLLTYQTHELFSNASIGAGSYKNGSINISKSGWYPLGVVGTYSSNHRCPFNYCRLTSRSSGSGTIAYNVCNWYSAAQTATANCDILWMKV